jgi:hypothetical protein
VKEKQPIMKHFVAIISALSMVGCSGAYSDLEAKYAVGKASNSSPLEAHTIVITSQNRKGAESYHDLATIRASDESIAIEISAPFKRPINIPVSEIAGCSMTCFGTDDQHIDLLIPTTGSDLMIPRNEPLLEWCWRNRKPMYSAAAVRNWQYSGVPLPPRDSLKVQFDSRAKYDEQTKQSCLGY